MTELAPLNPLLRAQLPEILERVSKARRAVADTLRPIAVDMAALLDFLAFELDRAELAQERAEWASRADTAPLEQRINYLKAMKKALEAGQVEAVTAQLDEVVGIVRRLVDESP